MLILIMSRFHSFELVYILKNKKIIDIRFFTDDEIFDRNQRFACRQAEIFAGFCIVIIFLAEKLCLSLIIMVKYLF